MWKHEAELKRKWLGKVPATPWGPLVRTGVQAEDRGCGVCSAPGSGGWGGVGCTRLDRQGCPLRGGPSCYCPRALESKGPTTSHVILGAFAPKGMAASGAKPRMVMMGPDPEWAQSNRTSLLGFSIWSKRPPRETSHPSPARFMTTEVSLLHFPHIISQPVS